MPEKPRYRRPEWDRPRRMFWLLCKCGNTKQGYFHYDNPPGACTCGNKLWLVTNLVDM